MANTRVRDIGLLKSIAHLLSKHGRYDRFQPCPNGQFPCLALLSFSPHGRGWGARFRKRARRL